MRSILKGSDLFIETGFLRHSLRFMISREIHVRPLDQAITDRSTAFGGGEGIDSKPARVPGIGADATMDPLG